MDKSSCYHFLHKIFYLSSSCNLHCAWNANMKGQPVYPFLLLMNCLLIIWMVWRFVEDNECSFFGHDGILFNLYQAEKFAHNNQQRMYGAYFQNTFDVLVLCSTFVSHLSEHQWSLGLFDTIVLFVAQIVLELWPLIRVTILQE